MIRSLFFSLALNFLFCLSLQASPFSDWDHRKATIYAHQLAGNNAANGLMTGKDVLSKPVYSQEQAIIEINKAKALQQWNFAISNLEGVVGRNPQNMNFWLDLALTAYWGGYLDKAEKVAVHIYLTTNDKIQKALALLIYAAATKIADKREKCLGELSSIISLKKLRKDFPEYAKLSPFAFEDHAVEQEAATPQICFTFSHPLSKGLKPADYFDITPKLDGVFHVHNSQICATGIRFGESYNVTIKEGIPSFYGEKTTQSSKISFLMGDKSSRLSFPTKTYILQKNDDHLIPLTAVNVKRVAVKVVRVSDRSFIEGFSHSHKDLDDELSDYSWDKIWNSYGEPLYEGTMDIGGEANNNITKQISLDTLVKDLKPGAYGIFVEDASRKANQNSDSDDVDINADDEQTSNRSTLYASQWVVITDIGMTVFTGKSGLDINTRSLSSAQPMGQVDVHLMSQNNQLLSTQKSNSNGLVHFDVALLKGQGGNSPAFIFAYGEKGDFAALKLSEPAFDFSDRGVDGRKLPGNFDAFLYTERGVYRPGETVRINTLLRDVKAMEIGGTPLTFRLIRPDSVVTQTATLIGNPQGYYDWNLPLSPSSRTGQWTVQAFANPSGVPIGQVRFSVEDFIPTRLLVTLKSTETFFNLKEPLLVDVLGRYLFGSAADGLGGDASLVIQRHPNPFPMYPGFQFGLNDDKFVSTQTELTLPTLDKDGKAQITVAQEKQIETSVPLQAVIQARVRDGGGRPQFGTLRLDVQNYPYMIGLKAKFKDAAIGFEDKTADIEIMTVTPQGEQKAVPNLRYTLYEEETYYSWSMTRGTWEFKPVRVDKYVLENDVSTTKDKIKTLSVPIEGWGYYRLEVKDPKTGAISSLRFTKGHLSSSSDAMTPHKLSIVQDKPAYAVGETIRLHIKASFDGEGLLVLANQDVLEMRNIKILKSGTDVTLTASESWGTGAYVLVSAFRPLQKKEKDPLRNSLTPKRAVGLSWIALSPKSRTLKVALTPPKEMKPRQKLDLPVHVDGNTSVDTFITVSAVDEGILMLTDFKTPKPEDYFFDKRMLEVEMRDLYGKILNPIPGEMGEIRSGGDEGILGRNLAALSKRSFRIVSLFQGPVVLDGKGNTTVPIDIPDFNGTLRLMAVAFNQSSIGSGDAQLLVRDPIVSEPVLPRFLGVGDTSQMSLSLFNPSEEKKTVKLSIKGEGALTLDEQVFTTTLEKEGTWHSQVPLTGKTIGDGMITLQLSGDGFDPITRTFEITVRPSTPPISTKSTFMLKPGETKSLDLKERLMFLVNTSSLTLSASDRIPWDLAAILKALITYPYSCVEQTTSHGFAVLYKKAEGILEGSETKEDLDKDLLRVFNILAERQDREGGFPLWSIHESESDPWLTAYVYDLMQQAKALGIKIPENTFGNAGEYLRNFVKSQSSYSSQQKLATAAYAMSLLAGQETIEDGAIRYFFDTYFDNLSQPLSRAQVGQALAKIGDLSRAKRAFQDFESRAESDPTILPYGSLIRNKAAMIRVLVETLKVTPTLTKLGEIAESQIKILGQAITPANPLSTQEQAWLLQAGQAFTTKGKGTSEKSAEKIQIAINDNLVERDKIVTETVSEDIISKDVTVSNKGVNPLWINTVLHGFPKEAPKAIEKGLKIKRSYYTLEGKEVNLDNKTIVTQGDQFIVVLDGEILQNTSQEFINYMLVVDWLPAGFEIESGRFGTYSEDKSDGEETSTTYPWDQLTETLTTEARDDRFVGALKLTDSAKTFRLAYRVRAVTPGTYNSSGLHVEDMFLPTIYARTAAGTLQIKAKGK